MDINCKTCEHDGKQGIPTSRCVGCCPQDQPTYIHWEEATVIDGFTEPMDDAEVDGFAEPMDMN
jgi:hypothetical protein